MKLPRRQFLHLAAGAAAVPVASRFARAQTYPTRPVRLIEGFGAGGTPDIIARLIGQWLSERLGQPFLIENRPGASGNIATAAVANARPDGHSLLICVASNAINASLYTKVNFDFSRDIVPIGGLMHVPFVLEVTPSFPVTTVRELIASAKANPGKINMASAGIGTPNHVFGEMFKLMAGIDMLHVPYRGEPFADLFGGQVQVYFGPLPASLEFIKAGKLRPLAVTTAIRSDALPDVPTVSEFLPGFEGSGWSGIGAPRNTPVEIVTRLNKEINSGLADPRLRARMADLGGIVIPGSSTDFAALIAKDIEKWAKVIKFAGIKVE
jgi:tripartite-type tricarboxylate transporter receptor subunit TctC